MMTLQELATIRHLALGIKIIVVNNSGYSMIRQTQDQWLDSDYVGSAEGSSFYIPDMKRIAETFELPFLKVSSSQNFQEALQYLINYTGDMLVELEIDKGFRVIPQVKFGCSNEDMEPLLDRTTFERHMIVKRP